MRIKVTKRAGTPLLGHRPGCPWLAAGPDELLAGTPPNDSAQNTIVQKEFRISHVQSEFIERLRLAATSPNPGLVITRSDIVQLGLDMLQVVAQRCAFSGLRSVDDF